MKKIDNIIIGAGISGLTIALKLKEAGEEFIILEAEGYVGGSIRSTFENGYIFDHGFQVYNTAYKFGKVVLDYEKLKLCSFKPGAKIYQGSKFQTISDPFRDFGKLYETLISPISNLSDKLKILQLKIKLRNYDLAKDDGLDCTTLEFLNNFGFSKYFIENFFNPFFGGVFLEKKLNTSAKFFKFVFSQFNNGTVCVPKKGMQKIPNQIYKKLEEHSVILNARVRSIHDKVLETNQGEKYQANRVIITSNKHGILPNKKTTYNFVLCYYFVTHINVKDSRYIYLFPQDDLINNVAILSSVSESYAPKGESLFSVSVLKNIVSPENIISKIKVKLSSYFGGNAKDYEFLKHYNIKKATLSQPSNHSFNSSTIDNQYIISGEQTTNGSIDGAIQSGLNATAFILK